MTSCKTSQEAICILEARRGPGGTSGFDLILKEHSPAQGTNACRLLRKAQTESVLKGIPIIGEHIGDLKGLGGMGNLP